MKSVINLRFNEWMVIISLDEHIVGGTFFNDPRHLISLAREIHIKGMGRVCLRTMTRLGEPILFKAHTQALDDDTIG